MDLALMAMRKLKKEGKLEDMEQSDEINACSVIVPVEMDYGDGPVTEEWLVFLKMKPITIRPKSNPSAVRPPVWAAQSATRFPAAVMYIRPCA